MEQMRLDLHTLNGRAVKSEARATELEKQLEHSTSQVRVAESKYLLLYEETQTLKQRLATCVFCDGEIEQRVINARKNVLRYMDALHSKVVMSQNTVRESFCGSFATPFQRLQTFFTQEVAPVSKFVDYSRFEVLIELCESISECETASKVGSTCW